MARYCIAYETMKLFQEVDGAQNLNELVKLVNAYYLLDSFWCVRFSLEWNIKFIFAWQLVVLCNSKEFRDVQLRNNEKKTLNTLNKDKNRITIRWKFHNPRLRLKFLIHSRFTKDLYVVLSSFIPLCYMWYQVTPLWSTTYLGISLEHFHLSFIHAQW